MGTLNIKLRKSYDASPPSPSVSAAVVKMFDIHGLSTQPYAVAMVDGNGDAAFTVDATAITAVYGSVIDGFYFQVIKDGQLIADTRVDAQDFDGASADLIDGVYRHDNEYPPSMSIDILATLQTAAVTLLDAETGAVLPNATIDIVNTATKAVMQTIQTDKHGSATARLADATGSQPEVKFVVRRTGKPPIDSARDLTTAVTWTLAPAAPVAATEIELALPPQQTPYAGARISYSRLLAADPLVGLYVELVAVAGGTVLGSGHTDANGSVRFSYQGTEATKFVAYVDSSKAVEVDDSGSAWTPSSTPFSTSRTINVGDPSFTVELTEALEPFGPTYKTVRFEASSPLVGWKVRAYETRGGNDYERGQFVTDRYGRFVISTPVATATNVFSFDVTRPDGTTVLIEDDEVDFTTEDVHTVETADITPSYSTYTGVSALDGSKSIFDVAKSTPFKHTQEYWNGSTVNVMDTHIDFRRSLIEARTIQNLTWDTLVRRRAGLPYSADLSGVELEDICSCKACTSADGVLAYLAELLGYVESRFEYDGGSGDIPASVAVLQDALHQPIGSIEVSCDSVETEVSQPMIGVEVLRRFLEAEGGTTRAAVAEDAAMRAARRDAYFETLARLGTSYTELRSEDANLRAVLADRLQIPVNELSALLLDPTLAVVDSGPVETSTTVSEEKLAYLFGFRATEVDLDPTSALPSPLSTIDEPLFVKMRREYLTHKWGQSDYPSNANKFRTPIIEPDIIGMGEVRPRQLSTNSTNPAVALLVARREFVDDYLATLAAAWTASNTLDSVLAAAELDITSYASTLAPLVAARDGLLEYEAELAAYYMTPTELAFIEEFDASALPTDDQLDELFGVLAMARKRKQYQTWREDELGANIVLSPDFFAIIPKTDWTTSDGDLSAAFLRRFDVSARGRFERILASRTAEWEKAASEIAQVVADVEESYRPAQRTALIEIIDTTDASLAEKSETLADQLLIDLQTDGVIRTSRPSQAIDTLQELVFSAGTGQLENAAFTFDNYDYDEVWKWLGSYDTWRAAVDVYMYPENYLDPTLRRVQSQGFRQLVDELFESGTPNIEDADEAAQTFSQYCHQLHTADIGASCRTSASVIRGGETIRRTDVDFIYATGPAGYRAPNRPLLVSIMHSKDFVDSDPSTSQQPWHVLAGVEELSVERIFGAAQVSGYVLVFVELRDGRFGFIRHERAVLLESKRRLAGEFVPLMSNLGARQIAVVSAPSPRPDATLLVQLDDTTYIREVDSSGWSGGEIDVSHNAVEDAIRVFPAYHFMKGRFVGALATSNSTFVVAIEMDDDQVGFMKVDIKAAQWTGYAVNAGGSCVGLVASEWTEQFPSEVTALIRLPAQIGELTFAEGFAESPWLFDGPGVERSTIMRGHVDGRIAPRSGHESATYYGNKESGAVALSLDFEFRRPPSVRLVTPTTDLKLTRLQRVPTGEVLDLRREELARVLQSHREEGTEATRMHLSELYYFAPLAIAQALNRAGEYAAALQWYRNVYDFTVEDERRVYLTLEAGEAGLSQTDWLFDAQDPHALAQTRPDAYLRYALNALATCLIDYAENEFAQDDADALTRARRLYETALDVLGDDALSGDPANCDVSSDVRGFSDQASTRHPLDQSALSEFGRLLELLPTAAERTAVASDILADLSNGAVTVHQRLADAMDEAMEGPSAPTNLADRLVLGGAVYDAVGLDPAARELVDLMTTQSEQQFRQGLSQLTAVALIDLDSEIPTMFPSSGTWLDDPNAKVLPRPGSILIKEGEPQSNADAPSGHSVSSLLDPIIRLNRFSPQPRDFCVPANSVYGSKRARAELGLAKLRRGLTLSGEERPRLTYRGAYRGVTSPAARFAPSQYRFSALIQRTLELAGLAEQTEAAYLRAREAFDAEQYRVIDAQAELKLTDAGVSVEALRVDGARIGVGIASAQQQRASYTREHFDGLARGGMLAEQRNLLSLLQTQRKLDVRVATQERRATTARTAGSAWTGIASIVVNPLSAPGAIASMAGAASAEATARAQKRAALNRAELPEAQFHAEQAERKREWKHQAELSRRDEQIATMQIDAARNNVAVAQAQLDIASLRAQFAATKLNFLLTKFSSAEFYDWMAQVLVDLFRWTLQTATSVAKLAELQLAFERQQVVPSFIGTNYWAIPAQTRASEGAREGITGSARLRTDIEKLRQHAFVTKARRHHLSKNVSLAAMAPEALHRLRQDGVASFVTAIDKFDRDFPAHYLRLIERVRINVIALTSPSEGIRARLKSSGISTSTFPISGRGRTDYQPRYIWRDAQEVAFATTRFEAGVSQLEANEQELLLPFEGLGVATDWTLEIPKASNTLDYSTIMDVVLTIDYSALSDDAKAPQVADRLPPRREERWFSFRNFFVDAIYELGNTAEDEELSTTVELSDVDFVYGDRELVLSDVAMIFSTKSGVTFPITNVTLSYTPPGGTIVTPTTAGTYQGVATTRRGAWSELSVESGGRSPIGEWTVSFPASDDPGHPIRTMLADETLEDIFLSVSYSVSERREDFDTDLAQYGGYEWQLPGDPVDTILAMEPTHFWVFDRASHNGSVILFQDSAKSTPVTTTNDPIGCAVCLVSGDTMQNSNTDGTRPTWLGSHAEFADSASQFFDCTLSDLAGPGVGVFWLASRHRIDGANQRVLGNADSEPNSSSLLLGTSTSGDHRFATSSANTLTLGTSDDNGIVRRWLVKCGLEGEAWVDNVWADEGSTGDKTMSGFSVGRNGRDSGPRYLTGHLYALAFFDRDLDADERSTLDAALAALGS